MTYRWFSKLVFLAAPLAAGITGAAVLAQDAGETPPAAVVASTTTPAAATPPPGLAAGNPRLAVDVAIIVDLAPQNSEGVSTQARLFSARTILSSLKEQDRVMVVGYTDKGIAYSDLMSLTTPEQREHAQNVLQELPGNPPRPFLAKALEQTLTMLSATRDLTRNQWVALVSEGGAPPVEAPGAFAKIQQAMGETLPKLARLGARVYTVSQGEFSNIPILKAIADDSGGRMIRLRGDLRSRMAALKSIADENRSLHINQNTEQIVSIKSDFKNFIMLAYKTSPATTLSLISPTGEQWNQRTLPPQHRWLTNQRFDLIALHHPPVGTWRMRSNTRKAEIHYVTSLKLHHNLDVGTLPSGVDYQFEARLTDKSDQPLPEEILEYFAIQVHIARAGAPALQTFVKPEPGASGLFRARLHIGGEGPATLTVLAESPLATLSTQLALNITKSMFAEIPASAIKHPPNAVSATAPPPPPVKPAETHTPEAEAAKEPNLNQKATGFLLSALEWASKKLEPWLKRGEDYAKNELQPLAKKKAEEALHYAQNDLVPQSKQKFAQAVDYTQTKIVPQLKQKYADVERYVHDKLHSNGSASATASQTNKGGVGQTKSPGGISGSTDQKRLLSIPLWWWAAGGSGAFALIGAGIWWWRRKKRVKTDTSAGAAPERFEGEEIQLDGPAATPQDDGLAELEKATQAAAT